MNTTSRMHINVKHKQLDNIFHEEELRKLKANHNELEAGMRRPQGDKHSAHTINECTQGESHPCQTNNTLDDNNISHAHRHKARTTRQHLA